MLKPSFYNAKMNFINNLKIIYMKLKLFSFKSFIQYQTFEESLNLDGKIDSRLANQNFNNLLSFYGLNPQSFSNQSIKLWRSFLIYLFIIGFIKFFILLFLDPINNYKLCIYLGDATLLFQSLRKYFLIILLLMLSLGFWTVFVFNHNSNNNWFEIFKCFDGTLTLKSIVIRDKKTVIKLLILSKIAFKLAKIITFTFTTMATVLIVYQFNKTIHINDALEFISVIYWFIATIFGIYFITGTSYISNVCFQITSFYCFIVARHFNQLINNLKSDVKSFRYKRFVLKLKIIKLIKDQNQFANRILNYNKFWSNYYFIITVHILPAHIICFQQALFGHLSLELKILFLIAGLIGTFVFVSISFCICLLDKQIKTFSKSLIQLQFDLHKNLNVNTKMKVSYYIV